MAEGFYMVWVEGKPQPTVKFNNLEEAQNEAMRLAKKEMATAYVLLSDYSYTPTIGLDCGYLTAPSRYKTTNPILD